ncbi:IPT/TIG domain-containing protein [Streptomyces sp. ACA25]|uniref:IPT/TIG domain-containing protein n=1 Tax=Streptomyces sp. ACA25 TaxID=3022596 RepID=UPI002307EFE9|nr:IPT/TIG domain-containing protein [Streptomyces sp. ACA25]MDB1087894.1 IPT/TIG domain-containing protein [Streptomyces sp. ACA25]
MPLAVEVSVHGAHVYVANSGSGTISVLDVGTQASTTAIAPFTTPSGVAVTPDNARLFVANSGTRAVSTALRDILDVTGTIEVGDTPYGIAVDPSGLRVYVTNQGSNTLSVIDTLSITVLATIAVSEAPTGVAVAPTGLEVYVTNRDGNSLSVINTATNTVVATLSGLFAPIGVAVTRDGSHLYVANSSANTVSVVDTTTRTVTDTIAVGATPWGVAASADSRQVYAANSGADTVSVIDTTTNTVTDTIAVGTQPTGIAVTPNSLSVYVANSGSDTVSVIQTLNAMAPALGPQSGGSKVTITGTNLSGVTSVRFGSVSASIIANTANQVIAVSPPGSGVAAVTVTTVGGTSNPKPFSYYPSGNAHSLTPGAGPTLGRNLITIHGSQLATANRVLFDAVPALPLIVSDQQLTVAVPPAITPGPVQVTVTTAGGLTTGTLTYTYVDPPQLTGLSTTTGTSFGGNVIALTGRNLATATAVTINGITAQYSIGSDTVLAVIVPPSPTTGPADVTVTTAAGTTTLPDSYTYT